MAGQEPAWKEVDTMEGTSSEAAGWARHTPDIVGHWVAHCPALQATPAANGDMVSVSPGCRREPTLPPFPDDTPYTFCAEFVVWGTAPACCYEVGDKKVFLCEIVTETQSCRVQRDGQ